MRSLVWFSKSQNIFTHYFIEQFCGENICLHCRTEIICTVSSILICLLCHVCFCSILLTYLPPLIFSFVSFIPVKLTWCLVDYCYWLLSFVDIKITNVSIPLCGGNITFFFFLSLSLSFFLLLLCFLSNDNPIHGPLATQDKRLHIRLGLSLIFYTWFCACSSHVVDLNPFISIFWWCFSLKLDWGVSKALSYF